LNKVASTKINTGFLAIVLIIGTFAAISPSFMTGAQAFLMDDNYEQDYGMDSYDDKQSYGKEDNRYDKFKDSSNVIVKNIECNNINVNNNGFNEAELNSLQPFLNGLASEEAQALADEGEIGASSIVSDGGRPSGSDTDFRVVCIYNNDNVVVEERGEESITKLCEECFAANSRLQTAILNTLVGFDNIFSAPFIEPPNTGILIIGPGTDTIEQLCGMIEASSEFYGVPVTDVTLEEFIKTLLVKIGRIDITTLESEIDALIECLLKAGIIVEGEPLPISISDNAITTQSNNAITTTPITTQSSNVGAALQSNNVASTTTQSSNVAGIPNTFSSSFSPPSSPLLNILPSNPN
jgi:hypothetical protein